MFDFFFVTLTSLLNACFTPSPYWRWLKSCTTKDDDYPIIYRVSYIPGGAGFLPSTVVGLVEVSSVHSVHASLNPVLQKLEPTKKSAKAKKQQHEIREYEKGATLPSRELTYPTLGKGK